MKTWIYDLASKYNLALLEKLTEKYEKFSDKIKDIAYCLHTGDKNLAGQLLFQEAISACDKRNYRAVKDILSFKTQITQDTLNKYCKIISSCVEKINKKNDCLNKLIPNSSSKNNIQYNSLFEKLDKYSENLFERVESVSKIIKKEQIIPKNLPSELMYKAHNP